MLGRTLVAMAAAPLPQGSLAAGCARTVQLRDPPALAAASRLQGKIADGEFIVIDAFALPVEGTETRVNAGAEAYEYMVDFLATNQVGRGAQQGGARAPACLCCVLAANGRLHASLGCMHARPQVWQPNGWGPALSCALCACVSASSPVGLQGAAWPVVDQGGVPCQSATSLGRGMQPARRLPQPPWPRRPPSPSPQASGREENLVGWYHSHPGYGCWLSGIDVGTQMTNQKYQVRPRPPCRPARLGLLPPIPPPPTHPRPQYQQAAWRPARPRLAPLPAWERVGWGARGRGKPCMWHRRAAGRLLAFARLNPGAD